MLTFLFKQESLHFLVKIVNSKHFKVHTTKRNSPPPSLNNLLNAFKGGRTRQGEKRVTFSYWVSQ